MPRRNGKQPSFSSGEVIVEYAILLPVLLMFVLGITDTGRLIWTQATLDRAVDAAARCGAINSADCGTVSQLQNYAVAQAYGLVIASTAFTASTASCGVKIVASFPFTFITPFIGLTNLTLSATACYPA
ncbi:MAG: TadE family protein [Alphaproteobacteria bacterium]